MLKVLVMGLPTSGKTLLAEKLSEKIKEHGLKCIWLNADALRERHGDWDFSEEGRMRQSERMRLYAELADLDKTHVVIFDFVAGLFRQRMTVNPNYVVWVNTVKESPYENTNKAFEKPTLVDVEVTEKDAEFYSNFIFNDLFQKGYLNARLKEKINN